MKVLVAEDDQKVREGLAEILHLEGFEVIQARDGEEALILFQERQPDFICLDVMMPKKSGYDCCRKIRSLNTSVPIIFISAKSEEIDKVVGLELGADDYILKPFGVKEVVARIRAVARRCLSQSSEADSMKPFVIGDLNVFPRELSAERDSEKFDLSLRETEMLRLFLKRMGKVVSRDELLDVCWGTEYFPNSRTLDQHIANLRKKIERDPKEPRIIQTVYGVGYWYSG